MGHCDSLLTQKSSNAGFQLYTVCRELLACPVPDSLPLANAAVLPLSVSTGAAALFINPEAQLPSNSPPQPTGKTVLVWGGSSSVGSSTIQLAVAAGLRVFATASKANCDYVKGLGASKAFDHREPNVVDQITSELGKGDFIVDCIGSPQTQQACGKILGAVGGGTLHLVLPPQATFPDNVTVNIGMIAPYGWYSRRANENPLTVNGLAPGFAEEELNGPWGVGLDRVGKAVWRDYMPTALESGKFQAKPDPHVIKGGLTKVQDGIDMLRKGVSAKKIVIEIAEE